MAVSPPSSSSGVDQNPRGYDVFISYRGNDTRDNFTSHLYAALLRENINTYIDQQNLVKGEDIARALPKAIDESSISIIILSTEYASSTWCLDELVHILKCQKEKDQIALPIFHYVDRLDIRNQKRSYETAFLAHEQRFNNEVDKVKEWRQALNEASKLPGWDLQGKSEADILEKLVKDVKEKLKYCRSNGSLEDLRKKLEEKLELANNVLEDAEEKQLTDEKVRTWLLEMKEVKYRADELLDKINYEELKRKQEADSKS